MTQKKETTSGKKIVTRKAKESLEKETISPLERWKMIAEAAYYRAQKRGFIGGNPMDDWADSEKEIDGKYTVDYGKVMMVSNPSEMMEQIGKVFGGILTQPGSNLDDILESQRKNIEALTETNKLIFENTQDIMGHQTKLFRDTIERISSSMKEAAKAKSSPKEAAAQQAKLLQLGLEKGFTAMQEIADTIVKGNTQSLDIANRRIADSMSELKRLLEKFKG
jgi:phasin family protein